MEEKINNKRIFAYIPSIIAKMILELDLNDDDLFFSKARKRLLSVPKKSLNQNHNLKKIIEPQSSIETNYEIFPVEYPLSHSIVMSVRLKGFEDLILSLYLKDKKKQNEKLYCEYIPIIFSKILLQISSILSENGGEILKCIDFEFIAVWDFSNVENIRLLPKYKRFYAKHALISAFEIMKKIDDMEIMKKYKLKISIGIEYGESSIYFFGGERRRSDFVIMGETIEGSEHCLNQCNPHEIIIGRGLNDIFKRKEEIITTRIGTDDKLKNLYRVDIEKSDEYELKNFQDLKNMKLKNNHIVMNYKVYENLSKKVYVFASVLPQGLVKYLDIGEDQNLKELSIVTIMTVHISMNLDLIDNSTEIQHLIKDMQKATYLTRGSLLGITKTFNGLMIKCAWGLEPNTFVDETARAIATSFAMKKLIDIYKIKLSIGISTGSCFTGLINIQGNRKMYSTLGYRAIISRLLADKANRRNIGNKNSLNIDKSLYTNKFIVYCDKNTVKYSQKWYRYNYISDLYMFTEPKQDDNSEEHLNKVINYLKRKNLSNSEKKKKKKTLKTRSRTKSINENGGNKLKSKNIDLLNGEKKEENNNTKREKLKNTIKIEEIYTPIEYDEYFFQNTFDPFPLIRTYKYNTHNRKENTFSYKNYLNNYLDEGNTNNNNEDNKIKNKYSNNNKLLIINNDINNINNDDFSPRPAAKSVYHKKIQRTTNNKNISSDKKVTKHLKTFRRINTYNFESDINKENKKTLKEEQNIYSYINNLNYQRNNTKDFQSILKLKKSQTIFGSSKNIKYLVKHMTNTYLKNKRQFYLIRGPLGCGKSLFIRKVLNNFIGTNDTLGENYFKQNYQFLFCNLINPFNQILPFNTISLIFRKIYLLLKVENRMNEIFRSINELALNDQTINEISFILSVGKDDIKLLEDFNNYNIAKNKKNKKKNIMHMSDAHRFMKKTNLFMNKENTSHIKKYEGPFVYQNIDIINLFFYEMIKIYFKYLKSKTIINNISLPLIFLIDDIQLSNHHSIEFINFLYRKAILEKDESLKPFIFIMIEQTPFNKNFKKIIPLELDIFINKYITFNCEQKNTNKIICLEEGPPYEKEILKRIIIFNFKNSVLNKYGSELKAVDTKILDFLLTKTFNGVPLLCVELLKSLIGSEKFIQTYSGEFIITSELNDESDIMDWNDILIPYIYEKIASNSLNKILNFKEILILKYASIIGTIFDMKILNKINPLNNIVKDEDIIKLVEKLNENYFIELHNEIQLKKNKLICQITFPFLRETLYQKFLMETRAPFHMKLAVIISMSKRIKYFSLDDELKFLKRNLFDSEANIIDEMKRKRRDIETLKDILESQKDLSYNNLKILLIKEICQNFYKKKLDNLLEGNIEMFCENNSEWIPVFYSIETKKIVFYNQEDEKKEKSLRKHILFFKLNSIFRNKISKDYSNSKKRNNILEITIVEDVTKWVQGIYAPRRKINYYFASERMKDIYQLEIGINFLKMKVNYDSFANCFGYIKFPLYQLKWFKQKEEKHYFDSDSILRKINDNPKKLGNKEQNNYIKVEKLLDTSKKIKKPFELLIKSCISCFLGLIQKNISSFDKNKNNSKNNNNNQDNLNLVVQIPNHIQKQLNNLFFLELYYKNFHKEKKYLNNESDKNDKSNKEETIIESNNEPEFKKDNTSEKIEQENNATKEIDENKKEEEKKSVKLNISIESEIKTNIKETKKEKEKLKSNKEKKENINLFLNNVPNNNKNKKNNKYSEFINKTTTISFPKKPISTMVKPKKINDLDEEPFFTESVFNTNNNISAQGDNSTKISGSTNIKTSSQINDKNISNVSDNEESVLDSLFDKKINNTNTNDENKILFNFENKKKTRNTKKRKLMYNSMDNSIIANQNKNSVISVIIDNDNKVKSKVKSYDDIFEKNIKISEYFVPFKSKNKIIAKHVNIISNPSKNKSIQVLKIVPSLKNESVDYSQKVKYKKLSNDPKYMYIDYYRVDTKIHKSKYFGFPKNKK